MKPRRKKRETRVGLDMGTRYIKAIELYVDDTTQRLQKLQQTEIVPPFSENELKNALKQVLEALRPSVRDVNISVSSPHAIVRFINMPRMKETELKNSLNIEAEKYIPFNIREVVTDASILAYPAENKRQMRVVFAAVKKKVLESRIAMLKDLGFFPAVVDIDGFACFNAFCNAFGNMTEDKTIAILNIGYTYTNLLIAQGATPFFLRDIQIGSRDMAKNIAQRVSTKEEKAEKVLFDPKDKAPAVEECVRAVLNNLADELRLSFGYYENQYGKTINEVYVSGGTLRLGGISKHLGDSFGVKTVQWDPFSKFVIDPSLDGKSPEAVRAQFVVSTGLAIR